MKPTLLCLAFLAGCPQPEPEPGCDNPVAVFPAQDSAEVYFRSEITGSFANPADDAAITLADENGAVAGRSSYMDGDVRQIAFTPEAPLKPSTDYTATAHWSCGDSSWSFTTSDVGDPVGALPAGGWTVDLRAGRWVEPAGLQQIWTPGTIELSTCADTAGLVFDDPLFEVSDTVVPFPVSGLDLVVSAAEVTGAFSPDGTSIQGVRITGQLDAWALLGATLRCDSPTPGPDTCHDELCQAVDVFSACEPCDDGSGDHCMPIDVRDLRGERPTDPVCE